MPKRREYIVLPAVGHAGQVKPNRYNVCYADTREVVLGPYHSEAAARIVSDALNGVEVHREDD
jgi:hypothetical protein